MDAATRQCAPGHEKPAPRRIAQTWKNGGGGRFLRRPQPNPSAAACPAAVNKARAPADLTWRASARRRRCN